MKTIVISVLMLCATISKAQIVQTPDGNFVQITKTQNKTVTDSLTQKTYTDVTGKTERVYIGSKGAYFVPRVSKSGNYYRKYLKVTPKQD